ncbi:hypothetical protein MUCCIDRAFT_115575 [Mucor lusitanicus CBS 277.49]|uniref:Kinetochore protein Nuf2 N-terminal domain-containing protein n=2 Tax=Mucor circinelloides f. lusitanicus TaxID=29924 RepID=A0A168GV79_MUCCL|nr:hypothetical protein MUCCIDRAFT_115575 [Mucor lusitanicus CBS 277.49]
MSRLPKARQQASFNSTTRQDRQRHHTGAQETNLSSGIPTIDVLTLVEFLQSLGIAAVESDVLEPNSRRTREMCELLLMYFVPHRMEALRIQKERSAMEFAESLEISMEHAEAMPVYREMHLFLEKIAFKEFTIVDILSPRSHRLQRMLSVVYNYKLFRDSAVKQFELLAQNAVDKTALYEARVAEREALKAKIQQLKEKREAERQEAQEWEAKNQEAEQTVRLLRKEGDAILKDIDAYKSERHQLKDTLQEIQFSMINVIEYVRALKQYEILNVDTLKKNIADLAVLIQKNTEEVSHIEENYPKVEEAAKGTKAIHNHLTKDIQRMEYLTKLKADANRQQKTNEAVKQNLQDLVARQKDLRSKLLLCNKNLNAYNDRLKDLAIQREKKGELVERNFRDFEEQKKALQQECELRENEQKKYVLDTEGIKEKCNIAAANNQHFMQSLYSEMQAILKNIDEMYQQTQAMNT